MLQGRGQRRPPGQAGIRAGILDGLFAATVSDTERAHLIPEAYREMARCKAYRRREQQEAGEEVFGEHEFL